MIYKFLKPPNFFKEFLSTYKGNYLEMCVPQTDDEKHCYAELTEKQFPGFAKHFGDNGEKLDNDSDEYPAGINSKINNRIEKFRIVRPSSRENPF